MMRQDTCVRLDLTFTFYEAMNVNIGIPSHLTQNTSDTPHVPSVHSFGDIVGKS